MATESGTESRSWRRRVLVGALKLGIALAVFVGLLEGALRLAPGVIPIALLGEFEEPIRKDIARARGLPTNDDVRELPRDDGGPPLRLWKPGATVTRSFDDEGSVASVTLDELGFPNPAGHAARARFDVVAIGDSFTWATNVEPRDTWPHRLAGAGTTRAVLNLGKDAIGLHEYVQILKAHGIAKKPRVVIMNVYEGNDLRDAERHARYRESGGEKKGEESGALSVLTTPFKRSYALNLVSAGFSVLEDSLGDPKIDFRYTVEGPAGESWMINAGNADRDEVKTARALVAGDVSLDLWDAPLATFVALAKEHGFRPVVAYSPGAYTAHEKTVRFERPEYAELMAGFSKLQRAWLAAAATRHGFTFVDLTPALQAAAATSPKKLYFPLNRHYSQAGHALVAKTLSEALGL